MKATLLAQFRPAVIETEEFQEGYAIRLPGDGGWIEVITELIVAERECCSFLAFEVAASPIWDRDCSGDWPCRYKGVLENVLCKPEG